MTSEGSINFNTAGAYLNPDKNYKILHTHSEILERLTKCYKKTCKRNLDFQNWLSILEVIFFKPALIRAFDRANCRHLHDSIFHKPGHVVRGLHCHPQFLSCRGERKWMVLQATAAKSFKRKGLPAPGFRFNFPVDFLTLFARTPV